jgi:hypothetical protein
MTLTSTVKLIAVAGDGLDPDQIERTVGRALLMADLRRIAMD